MAVLALILVALVAASGTLVLRTEHQSARMSKIKNGGLDQYSPEPFKQQQFRTAGVEGVNIINLVAVVVVMHQRLNGTAPQYLSVHRVPVINAAPQFQCQSSDLTG